MRIRLDSIHEEPFPWQETLELPPSELDRPELVQLGAVRCEGTVSFVEPSFFLRGKLTYEQALTCNRCLKEVTEQIEAELMLLVVPHAPDEEVPELELREQDMNVLHLSGEVFDTAPLVMEQVQLNVPMKPLCRPECAGLCPVCGVDRNETACSCEERTVDPRWAALQALRPQDSAE